MAYPYVVNKEPILVLSDDEHDLKLSKEPKYDSTTNPSLDKIVPRTGHVVNKNRRKSRNTIAAGITIQNLQSKLVPDSRQSREIQLTDGVASDVTYIPGTAGHITIKLFPNPTNKNHKEILKRVVKYHFPDAATRNKKSNTRKTQKINQVALSSIFLKRYHATQGFRIIDLIGNGLCGWFAKALADGVPLTKKVTDGYGKNRPWAEESDLVSDQYISCILFFDKKDKKINYMQMFNSKGTLSSDTSPEDRAAFEAAGTPPHRLPASKSYMGITRKSKIAVFINSGAHWMILASPLVAESPVYFGEGADPILWSEPSWRAFLSGLLVSDNWESSQHHFVNTNSLFAKSRIIADLPETF